MKPAPLAAVVFVATAVAAAAWFLRPPSDASRRQELSAEPLPPWTTALRPLRPLERDDDPLDGVRREAGSRIYESDVSADVALRVLLGLAIDPGGRRALDLQALIDDVLIGRTALFVVEGRDFTCRVFENRFGEGPPGGVLGWTWSSELGVAPRSELRKMGDRLQGRALEGDALALVAAHPPAYATRLCDGGTPSLVATWRVSDREAGGGVGADEDSGALMGVFGRGPIEWVVR